VRTRTEDRQEKQASSSTWASQSRFALSLISGCALACATNLAVIHWRPGAVCHVQTSHWVPSGRLKAIGLSLRQVLNPRLDAGNREKGPSKVSSDCSNDEVHTKHKAVLSVVGHAPQNVIVTIIKKSATLVARKEQELA
jgi:hypothetical protein